MADFDLVPLVRSSLLEGGLLLAPALLAGLCPGGARRAGCQLLLDREPAGGHPRADPVGHGRGRHRLWHRLLCHPYGFLLVYCWLDASQ